MYLFQLPRIAATLPRLVKFTFHYVSISTNISIVQLSQVLHLHSTMYLFQPKDHDELVRISVIYIPLCIYFNFKAILAPLVRYNLHSTMYLFKRETIITICMSLNIYIPLCIYLNPLPAW